jgi:hypothetical protein
MCSLLLQRIEKEKGRNGHPYRTDLNNWKDAPFSPAKSTPFVADE